MKALRISERSPWLLLGICGCLCLLAAEAAAGQARPRSSQTAPQVSDDYVEGELLIAFRPGTADQLTQFNQRLRTAVTSREEAITAFHRHYRTRVLKTPKRGPQRVRLAQGDTVAAMIKALADHPLVEYAEPNYRVHAAAISTTYTALAAWNDPYYADGHTQWWINRTRGDAAYAAGYPMSGSSDVIVAVIDTGVDSDHTELAGRLVAGRNVILDNNNTDDDNTWVAGTLVQGHGTHAAGLIVATANNSLGVVGTAWETLVKVMPIKALDSAGDGTIADLADAITWAADHGAHVINMSLGTNSDTTTLSNACSYAYSQGLVMVAAVGNHSRDLNSQPFFPAGYTTSVAVAATNALDYAAAYSNWGSGWVDCAAPGGAIGIYYDNYAGIWRDQDFGVTSTANTGGWSAVDGTSFAAPQVAGLAALLLLQNPSRNNNAVKDLIMENCDLTDSSVRVGSGRINILRALSHHLPVPSATNTASPTFTCSPTPVHTVTVTATRTRTVTPTPSCTPTPYYSPTATRTVTPTFTRTPSPTVTGSRTPSPTASPTPTMTGTFTITTTATASPTRTRTATITLTSTVTPPHTRTATPTISATYTASPTFTATATHTLTRTATRTATATASHTATSSATVTPTRTMTATHTASPTWSPTATVSPTRTVSPTISPTPTITATSTPMARDLDRVIAYPNPWRREAAVSYRVTFLNLPVGAEIRIYNLEGRLVRLIAPGEWSDAGRTQHQDRGTASWGLTNRQGQPAASGVYVFVITDSQGRRSQGKVALVR